MTKKKKVVEIKTPRFVLDLRGSRFGDSNSNVPTQKMYFLSEGFQQKSLGVFESRFV